MADDPDRRRPPSLGQRLAAPALGSAEAWSTFFVWIVPALLITAGGEALWIGESVRENNDSDADRLLPEQETVN